jgi:hypothetical protein
MHLILRIAVIHRRSHPQFSVQILFPYNTNSSFLLFIYSYVHTLFGPFLPHPIPCRLPVPLTPLASRQNLFCPLLQFCWRKNKSNNKTDIAVLLVWDKDRYIEGWSYCLEMPSSVRVRRLPGFCSECLPVGECETHIWQTGHSSFSFPQTCVQKE